MLSWRIYFDPEAEITREITGKFVLLRTPSDTIIVLGNIQEFPYHANLLAEFLSREQIPGGHWLRHPDEFQPPPEIAVNGGGWFRLHRPELTFYGSSRAYGPFDVAMLTGIPLPRVLSNCLLHIEK